MRLTTARYYTPSGVSIQAKGIEPDILVEAGITEIKKDANKGTREEDLRGALDNKNKSSKTIKSDNKDDKDDEKVVLTPIEKLKQDNQVSRAIDLIRGINLFSNKIKDTAKVSLNEEIFTNLNSKNSVNNE
jgi:carboxyl-terminal processing protease